MLNRFRATTYYSRAWTYTCSNSRRPLTNSEPSSFIDKIKRHSSNQFDKITQQAVRGGKESATKGSNVIKSNFQETSASFIRKVDDIVKKASNSVNSKVETVASVVFQNVNTAVDRSFRVAMTHTSSVVDNVSVIVGGNVSTVSETVSNVAVAFKDVQDSFLSMLRPSAILDEEFPNNILPKSSLVRLEQIEYVDGSSQVGYRLGFCLNNKICLITLYVPIEEDSQSLILTLEYPAISKFSMQLLKGRELTPIPGLAFPLPSKLGNLGVFLETQFHISRNEASGNVNANLQLGLCGKVAGYYQLPIIPLCNITIPLSNQMTTKHRFPA